MFTAAFTAAFFAFSAVTGVSAHPHHHNLRGLKLVRQDANAPFSAAKFPDVQKVLEGNQRFRDTRDAALFDTLVNDGQKPPFMMISCSDSRAPEATIFNSEPGTFFMERNIANQYKPGDENAQSVMAYGITVLGTQHIVVLGHYGCGGVAASIATAPKTKVDVATHIVQSWIGDIRSLYLQSNRTEIAEMRAKNLAIEAEGGVVGEPDIKDPGFRALVEENVKQQVKRITESSVISNLHDRLAAEGAATGEGQVEKKEKRAEEAAPLKPVFVHGWVHDLETGEVIDLNVSTGPKGFENFVPGAAEGENQADVQPPTGEDAPAVEPPVNGEDDVKKAPVDDKETPVDEVEEQDPVEEQTPTVPPVADEKTEAIEAPPAQDPVQNTPEAVIAPVRELGHHTIPAPIKTRRDAVLARLRRSLPQQRSYGKRFSRQV